MVEKKSSRSGGSGGFDLFVGVVGNPSIPDVSWSDAQLEEIKTLGVNAVQLSIAWGNKPADEVLRNWLQPVVELARPGVFSLEPSAGSRGTFTLTSR